MKVLILIIAIISLFVAGCGVKNTNSEETTLNIMAAASLTEAFKEIVEAYEFENPDIKIQLDFAGSQGLATQIEEGRQGDIFASANRRYMDRLIEKGFIENSNIFAENRLVVAVNNKAVHIKALKDLSKDGVMIAMADKSVPAGNYSDAILTQIQNSGEFRVDFKEKILDNTVSSELNVKDVMRKVEIGEVDAGLVYATDITLQNKDIVSIIDIKDDWNMIAKYSIGVLKTSPQIEESIKFINYLEAYKAREILETHGFSIR